jgi:hypothetical protein
MSGYETYIRLQRIEARAKQMGFRIGNPKHGWSSREHSEVLALYPAEGAMPTYSKDAELFVGTFGQLEFWLAGWEKAQQYDMLLRLSDEKKRKAAEGKEVERQRKERERLAKREMYAILSNKTEDQVDKLIK